MKRGREETHDYEDTFQTVKKCDFSTDELYALKKLIKAKYAAKLNLITQNLPVEIWREIIARFFHPDPVPQSPADSFLHSALQLRLVCKAFNSAALSPKSVLITPHTTKSFNFARFLCLSKPNALSVYETAGKIPRDCFTSIQELLISGRGSRGESSGNNQWNWLPTLTRIKSLALRNDPQVAPQTLLQLTHLQELSLERTVYSTLRDLTNLRTLRILIPTNMKSQEVRSLPYLENLICDDPKIFVEGKGTLACPSGSIYTGEWREAKADGFGTLDSRSNGLFRHVGYGFEVLGHGDRYTGDWQEGKRHGVGTCWLKNGDTYTGSWIAGKKHGRGTYTGADGDRYDGDWEDDQRHGFGTRYYPNGHTYVGGWCCGQRNGRGTYSDELGEVIFEGEWMAGVRIPKKYPGPKKDNL